MAFNPSPKVSAARDFANKFDKKQVVIISINNSDKIEYASYGKTKALCGEAKKMADYIFDEILKG